MKTCTRLTVPRGLFFVLLCANLWPAALSRAAVGLTLNPPSVSNTYSGTITLQVTGLTSGETVVVHVACARDGPAERISRALADEAVEQPAGLAGIEIDVAGVVERRPDEEVVDAVAVRVAGVRHGDRVRSASALARVPRLVYAVEPRPCGAQP